MESLRAMLRIYVVALALLVSATLAFVAITTKDGLIAQLFLAIWCFIITAVVLSVYREESAIAQNPIPVSGIVSEVKLGHRGRRRVRYQFVALDGARYEGESDWGVVKPITVGSDLVVLYKSLDPAVNRPLKRFWLYSFHPYGS
jgi:hypothetical protein